MRSQLIQYRHDVLATEPLAHLNGQTLPRPDIHDGQGPNPMPVRQLISHAVLQYRLHSASSPGPDEIA